MESISLKQWGKAFRKLRDEHPGKPTLMQVAVATGLGENRLSLDEGCVYHR